MISPIITDIDYIVLQKKKFFFFVPDIRKNFDVFKCPYYEFIHENNKIS